MMVEDNANDNSLGISALFMVDKKRRTSNLKSDKDRYNKVIIQNTVW